MNLKQCKLYVNSSRDFDTRFLWKTAIALNKLTIKLSNVLRLECPLVLYF